MTGLWWQVPAAGLVAVSPIAVAEVKERYGPKIEMRAALGAFAFVVGYFEYRIYAEYGWWGPPASIWIVCALIFGALYWVALKNMFQLVRAEHADKFRWYHWLTLPVWLFKEMSLTILRHGPKGFRV